MRKFILIITLFSVLALCSCTEEAENTENVSTTEKLTVQEVVQGEAPVSPAGAQTDSFTQLEMSDAEIFSIYAAAADKVKFYSAGFTRSFAQTVGEIETVGGSTALGSCIASLASENGIACGFSSSEIKAEHGDALTVNACFPIYGEEKGCREDALKCVAKASCGESAEYYSITLEFSECAGSADKNCLASVLALNTQPSFGEKITDLLAEDAETELFSEYSGGILTCVIEKSTSRMVYLKQNICIESYVNVTADMFVFADCQTQLFCSGKDEITFFDFEWN